MILWKDIPGWEGFYQAGTNGRVRSITRRYPTGRHPTGVTYQGRLLREHRIKQGYVLLTLTRPGQPRQLMYAHTAVLVTFIGPPPHEYEACHYNGVRHDNRLKNLRWDTRSANAQEAQRHKRARGSALSPYHPSRKGTL